MKSSKFWIVIFGSVVLVCAVAAVLIGATSFGIASFGAAPGGVANIYSNGKLIESIDLNTVIETRMIRIYDGEVSPEELFVSSRCETNIIEVEHGRIRVVSTNCGNRLCVRQGWISGGLTPIVCLPHGLVIRIEGGSGVSDIDGVVG